MSVNEILRHIVAERIIAVVRCTTATEAGATIEAMVAGGARTLEITTTTPDWEQLISDTSRRFPHLCVGVGTALESEDVQRAATAGGRFAASPVYDPPLMALAAEQGLLRMPGGATPTELFRAWRDGCELLKLFPTPPDPLPLLRALRGPLPALPIAPSGGITDTTAPALLAAGAIALNVGSWLTHASDGTSLGQAATTERTIRLRSAVHLNTP